MRLLLTLSILSVAIAAPLFAQDDEREPAPAAEITPGDFAIGYNYLNLGFSGKPAVHMNGVEASGMINVNPSWAATLDTSYVRAGRDPESGHSSSVLSALAGPVFIATRKRDMRVLVRGLVGMSLVDGSAPVGQVFYRGWQSRFSWAVGPGYERTLSSSFAVRFNLDYLRTHFIGTSGAVEGQNGIRLGANFVFRISPRGESHRMTTAQN